MLPIHRGIFAWSLLICVPLAAPRSGASPPGLDEGVGWLLESRIPGAGWGDPAEPTAVRDTAEAVRALASAGLGADPGCEDARAWLVTARPADLDGLARAVATPVVSAFTEQDASLLLGLFQGGAAFPLAVGGGGEDFWTAALVLRASTASSRDELLSRPDMPWILGRVAYTPQLLKRGSAGGTKPCLVGPTNVLAASIRNSPQVRS